MPRVEFARFDSEQAAKPAVPLQTPDPAGIVSSQSALEIAPASSPLSILLIAEDAEPAESLSELLQETFGDRSTPEWVDKRDEGIDLMRQNLHDVYVIADDRDDDRLLEIVRSAIRSGCEGAMVVLGPRSGADAAARAIAVGAADYIPFFEVTSGLLERSIRNSLLRQQALVQMRHENEALTAERTRLNLLREANHRFVENACHDFRSPLTVIKEFAGIIAEGLAGDVNDEQAEFLQIILTRVDHLSHMVDGILDASRLESDVIGVRREQQSVAKLIDQTRATLEQRAAAHKVSIEFAVPEGLPNVFADAESIGRVIVNIGANACKYAGENGTVKVWARYNPEERNVSIGVTDSGPGISPEHVSLIFDRFQQLPQDKGKDGFGLGLHISSELVRVNFGTLTVESEPRKGSTFAFTLPIFDVNSLIPLHFSFLKTSRHGFQRVSIALATISAGADGALFAEIERSLTRQLRSYDLLLRLREGSWLVCAAGDESDLTKITERILATYSEISRNRPEGRLPDIRFRTIGTWMLSSQPEGLTDAIRGAYTLSPEGRGVH